MKHQEDAIRLARTIPSLYLAWETGTGKTCATINIIKEQMVNRDKKILIVCPKVVMSNWKKEFSKFSDIDSSNITILKDSILKRTRTVSNLGNYPHIFITNYDSLQNISFLTALRDWGVELIVFDEAHILKNFKSKRAINASILARTVPNIYMLSGTPILNNALDLYMQYLILDHGRTFGTNFYAFRGRFFEDANAAWSGRPNHFPKFVPRPGSQDQLADLISACTLLARKVDCLDLPELVTLDLETELSKEQQTAYDEMKKYFVTYIGSEAVVAVQAITKALRLQQIVTGFVKTDTGSIIRFKDVPRMNVLREQLEELTPHHKVIVWACFKENYKMIREMCNEMGIKSVEIHGEVPDMERDIAIEAFENDPTTRVLIGNQGAGGIGINLTASSYSIYYSRTFKLGDDIQSRGRNYRRGSEQHTKITHINIVTPNTIDNLISDVLSLKLEIGTQILEYIQKKGKEYGIN